MKIEEIRGIAKALGIHPGKLTKTELIRTIQSEEGNFGCFATAYSGECDQSGCCWRADCLAASNHVEPT